MPVPRANEIPDSEKWTFIQRYPNAVTELIPLARKLVEYDLQSYEAHKAEILEFLGGTEASRVQDWSDYWISIIHTLGLAYISPRDALLHTTALAKFLNENNDAVGAFYNYWTLKFQFPWASDKHTGWKQIRKAVQPYVALVEHLVALFDRAVLTRQPLFETTYLTYPEIIHIIMKSPLKDHYDVEQNVSTILGNRLAKFDYKTLTVPGYDTVETQFHTRTRQYFNGNSTLNFDSRNRRVSIPDWTHLLKAVVFLAYRHPTVIVTDEQSRIHLFRSAFMTLNPDPKVLTATIEAVQGADNSTEEFDLSAVIYRQLAKQGLVFRKEFITAFLLSLKTKPFVILSGVSGTGKTSLPRAIMNMVGNGDCRPIAVAPDWTDNTDMLGYFDVNGSFQVGEFATLVKEANNNPSKPYFIVLDEMNLARVEYYFAQVLSSMESRFYDATVNDVNYGDYLFNQSMRDRLQKDKAEFADLKLSSNVYIIGTVNIDETTHPFSKKVLDRANVLEVSEVDLIQGIVTVPASHEKLATVPSANSFFKGNITNMKDLKADWQLKEESLGLPAEATLTTWVQELVKFSEVLKPIKMQFGFRMRDEVCIYLYHAACLYRPVVATNLNWWHVYFDQQLVQKVLTRVSGEQGQIEPYLVKLFNLCTNGDTYTQSKIQETEITSFEVGKIRFSQAAMKIRSMLLDVTHGDRPATSFWTANV